MILILLDFNDFAIQNKSWLSILASLMAFLSGAYGIFNKDTIETDPDSGNHKLSTAGWVTLIILLFAVGTEYSLKFAEDRATDADRVKEDKNLKDNFTYQLNQLKGLNSSLKANNGIQQGIQQTTKTITHIDSINVLKQDALNRKANDIYHNEDGILTQQAIANKNIHKTLNPLLPFGVSYTLVVKLDTNSSIFFDIPLIRAKKRLDSTISGVPTADKQRFDNLTGLVASSDEQGNPMYHVTPSYKSYKDFSFLAGHVAYIGFITPEEMTALSGHKPNAFYFSDLVNPGSRFIAEATSSFKNDPSGNWDLRYGNYFGIDISYTPKTNTFTVNYSTTQVKLTNTDAIFQSTDDLSGSSLVLMIPSMPAHASLTNFIFGFPPYFARDYHVKITDPGNQNMSHFNSLFAVIKLE